ncbi:flagellar biosynthesis anti-sigma factor FlgM [Tumebacillus permanentifrigoris]|uniref:FlgM family anti-sigma-28 factor n=1 Tax=Tumebacillus permanentifrigoris TaxID=378543 RepID=A0A316E065_9BACL|nr:flagellar biosynthesis anti-sigma factor FlgM [Tumebacillus permanentifrigoris]PWK16190.1 FlgM family anti-sigma-28 factor [Tumebacillus permanentifrigoris]
MKINDSNRISQVQKYQQANRLTDKDPATAASTYAKLDGVSISPQALEKARDLSQSEGSEHAERIADVKRQIQEGTYHVETNAVVRKMLEAYGE